MLSSDSTVSTDSATPPQPESEPAAIVRRSRTRRALLTATAIHEKVDDAM